MQFKVYYNSNSCCIILDHNTSAIHSFIKVVLDNIVVNNVNINHVTYFSDIVNIRIRM